jgi:hypothetical protein
MDNNNYGYSNEYAPITECNYCGDSCGEEVCYSCEETAEAMGVELW